MGVTITTWLWGSVLLLALAAPAAWAGWRVRRRFLSDWDGAPARLAESVLALAAVVTVCQLLGAIGLFRQGFVIGGVALSTIALGWWAGPGVPSPRVPRGLEADRSGGFNALVAATAVAVVAGQWTTFTLKSMRRGITAADSIWYHLPRAARFVQTGWLTRLHYTAPEFPDTFHPANGELVQALPMLMFQRDAVSALINLGWLALLLLAAWCVGRPFGQEALSLIGAAALLATPLLVVEGAGNAGNDIAASFFLLAAVALLLQPTGGNAAVVVAGLAAGLAISTKLTVVPAVVVLSGGVLWSSEAGRRCRRVAAWAVPVAASGSYWYVRNWLAVGSPVPATHLPFFPAARFSIADRLGFSVFDYASDGRIWRKWFIPGLRADFGLAWPLVVGLLVVACIGVTWRGHGRVVRSLGAVLGVSTVAYLVLPTTALGERGAPVLFAGNVIYLAPVLLLALVVLPVVSSRAGSSSGRFLLVAYGVLLALGSWTSPISTFAAGWGAVGFGAVLTFWLLGLWAVRVPRGALVRPIAGAVAAIALVVGIVAVANRGESVRYADLPLLRWANDVTDARIAVAGFTGQFPLYGPAIDNVVQYVGEVGPHGEFHDVSSCTEWRRRLRSGAFNFVVLREERSRTHDRQQTWTSTDPAAALWLHVDGGYVFRFDSSIADPGCG